MNRPLLISDCDEVLLHMARHFGDWVGSDHNIDFNLDSGHFANSLFYRDTGLPVETERMWPLFDAFFENEMHRQTLVPDVIESLGRIGEVADIVILTNIGDRFHPHRVAQLDSHGIRHEIICNQGGKGPAVSSILGRKRPKASVFVDDLAMHHGSVAEHEPQVWRLHMVADLDIARLIAPAADAHNRIDTWAEATGWVLDRLEGRVSP